MTQTQAPGDLLDALLGIEEGSALHALRARRADPTRFTQDSYQALLEPEDLAGLSHDERDLVALRAALLAPSAVLAAHYRARLEARNADPELLRAVEAAADPAPELAPRLRALLTFTDLLSRAPRQATPADSAALTAAGFSTRDVVTVAQLIAFVSYQARVAASLRALKEAL